MVLESRLAIITLIGPRSIIIHIMETSAHLSFHLANSKHISFGVFFKNVFIISDHFSGWVFGKIFRVNFESEKMNIYGVCLGSPTPTVSWMKDVEAISDVSRDPRVTINNTGSLRIESKLNKYIVAYLNNPPRFLPSQLSVFGWGRSGSDEKVRR